MAHSIRIDFDACTGCRECVDSCFVDVIRWDEDKDAPFGAYPEDCQVCCVCEKVCPVQAIEIIPDWKSKYIPEPVSEKERCGP
jgi:NAD-dependent dihydropyrimidine dehydrogenase PreA subunit